MASLSMAFAAATAAAAATGAGAATAAGGRSRRMHVLARRATSQGAGSTAEEKGLLDWILGSLQKEDQLLETDPVLNKVEEKSSTGGTSRKSSTTAVSAPTKKPGGGFGGLFARN